MIFSIFIDMSLGDISIKIENSKSLRNPYKTSIKYITGGKQAIMAQNIRFLETIQFVLEQRQAELESRRDQIIADRDAHERAIVALANARIAELQARFIRDQEVLENRHANDVNTMRSQIAEMQARI